MNKLIFEGKEYELKETEASVEIWKADGAMSLNHIKTKPGLGLSSPYQYYKTIELNGKFYMFYPIYKPN